MRFMKIVTAVLTTAIYTPPQSSDMSITATISDKCGSQRAAITVTEQKSLAMLANSVL